MYLLHPPSPSCFLGAQITAAAPVTVPAVPCATYAAVTIRGGSIVSVSETVPRHARYPVIDYGYAVISPGVIDVHVHMNEPGREDWEGEQRNISSREAVASAAAAAARSVSTWTLRSFPPFLVAAFCSAAAVTLSITLSLWCCGVACAWVWRPPHCCSSGRHHHCCRHASQQLPNNHHCTAAVERSVNT
jgi:hypothetical protein